MGQYDEKDFFVFTETDPVSTDGKNRWQEGIDAWAKEQGDEKYKAPRETSDYSPTPTPTQGPTSTPTPQVQTPTATQAVSTPTATTEPPTATLTPTP